MYKCVKCKKVITNVGDRVRCTYCGFRILSKLRPDTVKRVHAR